jgi:aldehyde:ferredoxin oxidoreductase
MIDKEKFIKMVDELYEHQGLDQDGIPKPKTLESLGLKNEPSQLL